MASSAFGLAALLYVCCPCLTPVAIGWAALSVVVSLFDFAAGLLRWVGWLAAQATCGCCWRGLCGCVDDWALLEWAVRNDVPAAVHGVVARARSRDRLPTAGEALWGDVGRPAHVLTLPDARQYVLASNRTAVRRRVLPLVLQHPLLDAPGVAARIGLACVLDIASPAAWDRMAAHGADVADMLTVRMESGVAAAGGPCDLCISQAACLRAQDDGKPRVLVAALDQCQPAAVQWLLARPEMAARVRQVTMCVSLAASNMARHRTVASLACLRALVAFVQSAAAPGAVSCRPAVEALDVILTDPSGPGLEDKNDCAPAFLRLMLTTLERYFCCNKEAAPPRGDVVCCFACRLHRSPCARAPAVAARQSDTVVVHIGPEPSPAPSAAPLANLHPRDEQRPANMSAMVQEVRRHGEGAHDTICVTLHPCRVAHARRTHLLTSTGRAASVARPRTEQREGAWDAPGLWWAPPCPRRLRRSWASSSSRGWTRQDGTSAVGPLCTVPAR
jgi:hypothetical protein